jgi:hypothetical protein
MEALIANITLNTGAASKSLAKPPPTGSTGAVKPVHFERSAFGASMKFFLGPLGKTPRTAHILTQRPAITSRTPHLSTGDQTQRQYDRTRRNLRCAAKLSK